MFLNKMIKLGHLNHNNRQFQLVKYNSVIAHLIINDEKATVKEVILSSSSSPRTFPTQKLIPLTPSTFLQKIIHSNSEQHILPVFLLYLPPSYFDNQNSTSTFTFLLLKNILHPPTIISSLIHSHISSPFALSPFFFPRLSPSYPPSLLPSSPYPRI